MSMEAKYFYAQFRQVPRPQRDRLLCAMIRVNYGTAWEGDLEVLKDFFLPKYHKKLIFGGLSEWIEALNPFADEPTDHSLIADEITIHDGEISGSLHSAPH